MGGSDTPNGCCVLCVVCCVWSMYGVWFLWTRSDLTRDLESVQAVDMSTKIQIEEKISEYGKKLTALSPDQKRIKKRILQALGKLKKDLERYDGGAEVDQPETQVPSENLLTRKQLKMKLKLLNKEISEYAQKKQLKLAVKRFAWGVRKGMEPDVHTYANMMNVHVRCGDLDGAKGLLESMKVMGVVPNIVVYTILLKGCSDSGDIEGASRILFDSIAGGEGGGGDVGATIRAVRPNARAVNTYLRGCMRTGAVQEATKAMDLLFSIPHPHPHPHTRCRTATIKHQEDDDDDGGDGGGDAEEEEEQGAGEADASTFEANATTFDYVVGLLSQAFRMSAATALLERISAASGPGSHAAATEAVFPAALDNAGIYTSLSKGFALLGEWDAASKWTNVARVAIESSKSDRLRDVMMKKARATSDVYRSRDQQQQQQQLERVAAGDRADKSLSLFLQHRREELARELDLVDSFTAEACQALHRQQQHRPQQPFKDRGRKLEQRLALMDALSRVLYFGFGASSVDTSVDKAEGGSDELGEAASPTRVAAGLVLALRDKFGLSNIANAPAPLSSSQRQVADEEEGHRPGGAGGNKEEEGGDEEEKERRKEERRARERVVRKVLSVLDDQTSFIDFDKLFTTTRSPIETDEEAQRQMQRQLEGSRRGRKRDRGASTRGAVGDDCLPIKMEICSGSGEWVVAQALADMDATTKRPLARWVALELRCDRVHDTLCRSVFNCPNIEPDPSRGFAGLAHLALLGGDAAQILPLHVAPGSISAIFINHPEPPERTGGEGDSQGKHLLTHNFLRAVHRVLRPRGRVTIVTDNLAYGKSLMASVADLARETLARRDLERRGGVDGTDGEGGGGGALGQGDSGLFASVPLRASTEPPHSRSLQEEMVISGDGTNIAVAATPCAGASSVLGLGIARTLIKAAPAMSKSLKGASKRRKGADQTQEKEESEAALSYFSDDEMVVDAKATKVLERAGPAKSAQPQVDDSNDSDSDSDSDSVSDSDGDSSSSSDGGVASLGARDVGPGGAQLHKEAVVDHISNAPSLPSEPAAAFKAASSGRPDLRVQLWRAAAPGSEAGHVADSSSYFDRMWDLGAKKRRWFLLLEKM